MRFVADARTGWSALTLSAFWFCVSYAAGQPASTRAHSAIRSVSTSLDLASSKQEIDHSDPNDTPFHVCAGVGGYALIRRQADSGRVTLDVRDPSGKIFPLDFPRFVTPAMSSLTGKPEWRVLQKKAQRAPVAIIIPLQTREDPQDPEIITRTLLVVIKITPTEICVTDRLNQSGTSATQARRAADSAPQKPCVSPL